MTDQEFKTQVFKEPKQWQSGLFYRLQLTEENSLALAAMPAVSNWIDLGGIANPACLAADSCGQVYFIDSGSCRLYLYDPAAGRTERLSCFGGRGSEPGLFASPSRMIIGRHTLWVVDTGNCRIQAFALENLQLKYVIDNLAGHIDMALSGDDHLFLLDQASRQIHLYDIHGRKSNKSLSDARLLEPVSCAVGKDKVLFVIDNTSSAFLRFRADGVVLEPVGDFNQVADGYKPTIICIDGSGTIYVGDQTIGGIYQFSTDGSYLGPVPGFNEPVIAFSVDHKDNLYVAGPQGFAILTPNQRYSQEPGLYFSKTLDSGIQGCQWHRLAFQVTLPPRTTLEVYYYSSEDGLLKEKIDGILSDQKTSVHRKKELIDEEIPESAWVGPERNPVDMLFREKTRRYLWLKLALSTFDDTVTPAIAGMRVLYPRTSYLRYLPAIYQEDQGSREFLERYLSVFESIYVDLETVIAKMFRYFDPSMTPPGFLPWLASWLDMALEEQWPEEKKRRFIAEAYHLYSIKGTSTGIMKLVELYTGKTPHILEHQATGTQLILGREFRLGINSLLARTPIRGFRLGDDAILGRVALRDEANSPADPFLQFAHRFTVILDLSEADFGLYRDGLKKLLDAEKPAETSYVLRITQETGDGIGSYVGINTHVAGYRSMKIGVDSILGSNLIVFDNDEPYGKVERRSIVGKDTRVH